MSSPPERRERHFRMDLRTGRILDPDLPAGDEEDEEWRPIGTIDQTGAHVDYSLAHRWRPLGGVPVATVTPPLTLEVPSPTGKPQWN